MGFAKQKWVAKLLAGLANIFTSEFGAAKFSHLHLASAKFSHLDLAGAKFSHLDFCPAKCSIFPLFWNSLVFDHQKLN